MLVIIFYRTISNELHLHKVSINKKLSINCKIRIWVSSATTSFRGNSFTLSRLNYRTGITMTWSVTVGNSVTHNTLLLIIALKIEFLYSYMPSVYLKKLWIDKRKRSYMSLCIFHSKLVEHCIRVLNKYVINEILWHIKGVK